MARSSESSYILQAVSITYIIQTLLATSKQLFLFVLSLQTGKLLPSFTDEFSYFCTNFLIQGMFVNKHMEDFLYYFVERSGTLMSIGRGGEFNRYRVQESTKNSEITTKLK